ncbi:MAG: hypothetical protein RDV48_13200 [Candidatus Eremiobacteraeota bacterium]|nr:hypothetical protein [Candidatus Eremiobacteraeota bacterium]
MSNRQSARTDGKSLLSGISSGTAAACLLTLVFLIANTAGVCQAEEISVKLLNFYTSSYYSTGETSDILASYLTVNLPRFNKVWFGYQSLHYHMPYGFLGGSYKEEFHTMGGYFVYNDRISYQADYFFMSNSLSLLSEIVGGEVFYRMDPQLAAGLGFYSAALPFYHVNQTSLRLYYTPPGAMRFTTKVYFANASDSRLGTAVQEKIDLALSPSLSLQLSGATGKRINCIDNDVSNFYTNLETLNSSYGAQITGTAAASLDVTAGWYRDNFDRYWVNKYYGGITIRF